MCCIDSEMSSFGRVFTWISANLWQFLVVHIYIKSCLSPFLWKILKLTEISTFVQIYVQSENMWHCKVIQIFNNFSTLITASPIKTYISKTYTLYLNSLTIFCWEKILTTAKNDKNLSPLWLMDVPSRISRKWTDYMTNAH